MSIEISGPGTVTRWVRGVESGDEAALVGLWQTYGTMLVRLALGRLRGSIRCAAREQAEDAAQSAFHSFYRGLVRGRFPRLDDRDDLWRVLVVIAARKAGDRIAREWRQKRGGRLDRVELDLDDLHASGLPPEEAVAVIDQCRHLLDRLGNETLRLIALWKLEGYSAIEIAERLGCTRTTVQRKLGLIRARWAGEVA